MWLGLESAEAPALRADGDPFNAIVIRRYSEHRVEACEEFFGHPEPD